MKILRPQRSYKAVIDSLAKVWRIERVPDDDAIWQLGHAELHALPRDHLRIGIWNLCKGAGGETFERDYRVLAERSDLVLAQEALLSERSLSMFCSPGFCVVHAASYRRSDLLRDGVLTASRVTAVREEALRITCKYPEPFLKTPKVALVNVFPLEGSTLRLMVINIHATLIRLKAAAVEEMEHLLGHLPNHDGPMILAGDFNTFTKGYLKAVCSVLRKKGLEYVPIPGDPRSTTQALDQVFIRNLELKQIRVETSLRNSDHFPITCTLRYLGP